MTRPKRASRNRQHRMGEMPLNSTPTGPRRQPRASIRMDARLDTMTRAKLEELATTFHRSRAAVLREVMRWGLGRGPVGKPERDDPQGPFHPLFFEVKAALHQQVGEAARGAGMDVAPWLRHLLREITVADFPASWRAGGPARRPPKGGRSHDSRHHDHRLMVRLDAETRQRLERFSSHFHPSIAEVVRQLAAMAWTHERRPGHGMATGGDHAAAARHPGPYLGRRHTRAPWCAPSRRMARSGAPPHTGSLSSTRRRVGPRPSPRRAVLCSDEARVRRCDRSQGAAGWLASACGW
jgi:predicted DNA-binding protein